MLIDIEFGQKCYRLDVRGVREHVDGLYIGDGIAAGGEVRRVTRQSGGVAGDVDDAARLPVGDGRERFFIAYKFYFCKILK